jgi:hypothetical protein
MVVYVENIHESIDLLLEFTSKLSKIFGYKINKNNWLYFHILSKKRK